MNSVKNTDTAAPNTYKGNFIAFSPDTGDTVLVLDYQFPEMELDESGIPIVYEFEHLEEAFQSQSNAVMKSVAEQLNLGQCPKPCFLTSDSKSLSEIGEFVDFPPTQELTDKLSKLIRDYL